MKRFTRDMAYTAEIVATQEGWRDKKKLENYLASPQSNKLYSATIPFAGIYVRDENVKAGNVYELEKGDVRHLAHAGMIKEVMPDKVLEALEVDIATYNAKVAAEEKAKIAAEKKTAKNKNKNEDEEVLDDTPADPNAPNPKK